MNKNNNKNSQINFNSKSNNNINSSVSVSKNKDPENKNYLKIFSPVIAIFVTVIYLYTTRTGQINGNIFVDSDLMPPLSDVKITLDGKEINNKESTFTFKRVKSGEHNLTFEKSGFNKLEKKVTLDKGEIEDLSIRLSPIKESIITPKGKPLFLYQSNDLSINVVSNTNFKNKIEQNISSLDSVFSVRDQLYILDSINSKIHIFDTNNFKTLKTLDFEINSKPSMFSLSNQKDKAFIVLSNKNNISTVDLDTLTIDRQNEESLNNFGQIKAINHIEDSNKVLLSGNNKIAIYNPLSNTTETINLENVSSSKIGYLKNNVLLLDDNSKEFSHVNLLTKESKKIKSEFYPFDVISTTNNIIATSKENIYKFDYDKGLFEQLTKEPLNNISDVFYSSLANRLYIIEKESKNIKVFDLNKNEFLKDNLDIYNASKIKFIQ